MKTLGWLAFGVVGLVLVALEHIAAKRRERR